MFVLSVLTKCKLDQIKAKFWMTSRFKFFKNSHWRENVVTGTEVQTSITTCSILSYLHSGMF